MTPWTKRLAVGFAISLAINLLLGGFLLGRGVLRSSERELASKPDASATHGRPRGPWRGALQGHREELRARQGSLRSARRAAREALAAPNFDAERFERALAAVRAETARSQEELHRSLVEAATRANAEERRELTRSLDWGRK